MAALTAAQRASVRMFLGWPSRFYQTNTELEGALSAIDQADTATQDQVVALLASLDDVDAKLLDAHGRLKAGKVGSIDLPGEKEVATLRSEGRRFVGRLAAMLGVEPMHDVFSGSSPRFQRANCDVLLG